MQSPEPPESPEVLIEESHGWQSPEPPESPEVLIDESQPEPEPEVPGLADTPAGASIAAPRRLATTSQPNVWNFFVRFIRFPLPPCSANADC